MCTEMGTDMGTEMGTDMGTNMCTYMGTYMGTEMGTDMGIPNVRRTCGMHNVHCTSLYPYDVNCMSYAVLTWYGVKYE